MKKVEKYEVIEVVDNQNSRQEVYERAKVRRNKSPRPGWRRSPENKENFRGRKGIYEENMVPEEKSKH